MGPTKERKDCTSGVKDPHGGQMGGSQFFVDYVPPAKGEKITEMTVGKIGGANDTLKMLSTDETIDMRLFVDNTITEVYWMGGRVAMTSAVSATQAAGMSLSASGKGVTLASAQAWRV